MRLDIFISSEMRFCSREKARYYIKNGDVSVNGTVIEKPSYDVSEKDGVEIRDSIGFVGKGGLKLKKAIESFRLNFFDKTVLDVGASTGGFTDCALQNGAKKVYAVDVGHGQLDPKLASNDRVVNFEGRNILDISPENIDKTDIVVSDVSFVSIKKILFHISNFIDEYGQIICLVKPQFEVGKKRLKNGVVSDEKTHVEVVSDILDYAESLGLTVSGLDFSPIKGGEGNIEFLLYLTKNSALKTTTDIKTTVRKAHETLKGR
jgi:23S rRNA (cytidine1920-2'-O)/16S rRNA (cytidine1409-2'-O)-methyltransferase